VPPCAQVQDDDDQGDRERHRERVEDRHDLHRLELEQQVVSPGDVRRQRGGEVDEPDREGDRRGEGRQAETMAMAANHVDSARPAGVP
jgi:hypothetical protein